LRGFHRANRALLFPVFANFAFAFYALFAFFAFRAYCIYFIAHIARFLLLNFWEETMLSVRAEVSLQNLRAFMHAHDKTERF